MAFSHYNNISAQLGVDPATGALVAGGVKAETEQALKNIKAIIESVDHVLEDCVKVNIFVKDMDDMDAVNEVYAHVLPRGNPCSSRGRRCEPAHGRRHPDRRHLR